MLAFSVIVGAVWRFCVVAIKRIEAIAKQFSPNGGSSLRDAIDRVERGVTFGEKRSRVMFDSQGESNKGWFETDKVGNCVFVSNSWCKMHEAQRDEALGTGWLNVVSESSYANFVTAWHNAIEGSRSFDLIYLGHKQRQFHMHAERVVSAGGDLIGYIGFVEARGRVSAQRA